MAESFVTVATISSGPQMRTENLTIGGNSVQQEVVTISDAATAGNVVTTNVGAGGSGNVGLLVTPQDISGNAFARTSSTNLNATIGTSTSSGMLVAFPGTHGGTIAANAPAVGSQATTSLAAGTGTQRWVCQAISARIFSDNTGATAGNATLNLRDGASGAGTVLWSWIVFYGTTTNFQWFTLDLTDVHLIGSAATAMTLEFVAGAAHLQQVVNISGFLVQ